MRLTDERKKELRKLTDLSISVRISSQELLALLLELEAIRGASDYVCAVKCDPPILKIKETP